MLKREKRLVPSTTTLRQEKTKRIVFASVSRVSDGTSLYNTAVRLL